MIKVVRVSGFVLVALLLVSPALAFTVTFGTSWDGVSLQEVLDTEYGPGAIDVMTDYVGALPGDADPPYWEDLGLDGIIVREIAGYSPRNILGWYMETFSPPTIDGVDDGVIFTGPLGPGATESITFPSGVTTFGFYLNPNGDQDAINAPEPELFFVNRFYNDLGVSGGGAVHLPLDGDVQCLVYNISHLRNGVPTFVLAWEDLDYSGDITPSYCNTCTDNDYQDFVVEVSALAPVPVPCTSFGKIKALFAHLALRDSSERLAPSGGGGLSSRSRPGASRIHRVRLRAGQPVLTPARISGSRAWRSTCPTK